MADQYRLATYSYTHGGARLRRLRTEANKTQLVVEADTGLGSGYVQRIESGKVQQPTQSTLERILTALDANYSQRREVLALFGYRAATTLPNDEEIAWARALCRLELEGVPFPAYLLDCSVRLLAWNRYVPRLFPVVAHEGEQIAAERWSMLRLWFDQRYGITERVRNPETLFPQLVRAFRHELCLLGEEPWCDLLIASLVREMPLFRVYWERNDPTPTVSAARVLVPLSLRLNEKHTLHFRISAEPLTYDTRFRIIYLLPADPLTIQVCAAWATQS